MYQPNCSITLQVIYTQDKATLLEFCELSKNRCHFIIFQLNDKFYLFIFLGWKKMIHFQSCHLQRETDSSTREYTARLLRYWLQTAQHHTTFVKIYFVHHHLISIHQYCNELAMHCLFIRTYTLLLFLCFNPQLRKYVIPVHKYYFIKSKQFELKRGQLILLSMHD